MTQASKFNLYVAVLAANVGALSLGSLYNWSSPALPKLSAKDSWLPIDIDQASWIGSLINVGSIFGPFIGGFLVDRIGRKGSIIVAVFIGLASWATLYFTTQVWHIYVSRLIGGLGGGVVHCVVPVYVAEIAEDSVRGSLGATFNFAFSAGYLIEYSFGPFVSYWTLIKISCVSPIIFFLMCPFLPESPYYYIIKNNIDQARKSLQRLRKGRTEEEIDTELESIKHSVEESMKQKGTLLDLVSTRANRRALLMSCGAMTFQQMSGINVVLFYSETIFQLAGNIIISASSATIVVALVLISFAGVAAPLTQAFGIRNMLISSASIMFFFQTVSAVYFYFLDSGADVSVIRWLPVINLAGYVIGYSVGFGPLPTAVKGEVFSANVKGASSAVTVSWSWTLSFITTKFFPYINEWTNTSVVFTIFSVFCFIAILFSVFIILETRDMSLQDIQDMVSGKRPVKVKEQDVDTVC